MPTCLIAVDHASSSSIMTTAGVPLLRLVVMVLSELLLLLQLLQALVLLLLRTLKFPLSKLLLVLGPLLSVVLHLPHLGPVYIGLPRLLLILRDTLLLLL